MSDIVQEGLAAIEEAERKRTEPGTFDYLQEFAKSALFSGREFLTGQEPPLETERWNAQHPVAAFVGGMATPVGAYGAWFKASKAVKKFDDLVGAVGSAERPIAQAAAQNVVRFAPARGRADRSLRSLWREH